MNDMPIFQPSPMFEETAAETPPKRNRRKPRQAQPEQEAPPKPRKPKDKPRRKKAAKADKPSPAMVKVNIKTYAAMVCAPTAKEFVKIHRILAALPSLARDRLLAELVQVFK